MPDENESKGDGSLRIGQTRSLPEYITLEGDEFTREELEKVVARVIQVERADFGRERNTLKGRIKELETENEGYKSTYDDVQSKQRELIADKLAGSEAGKKAKLTKDFILKRVIYIY